MGWWKTTDDLICGDTPADIMGDAIDAIRRLYLLEWGREVTEEEITYIIDFVRGPDLDTKE